jgi:hypothetical protein
LTDIFKESFHLVFRQSVVFKKSCQEKKWSLAFWQKRKFPFGFPAVGCFQKILSGEEVVIAALWQKRKFPFGFPGSLWLEKIVLYRVFVSYIHLVGKVFILSIGLFSLFSFVSFDTAKMGQEGG